MKTKMILIDLGWNEQAQTTTREIIKDMPNRVPGLTQTTIAADAGVKMRTLSGFMAGHNLSHKKLLKVQVSLLKFHVVKESDTRRISLLNDTN